MRAHSTRLIAAAGRLLAGAAFLTATIALHAPAARAHKPPVDLSVWGNFGTSAAICQRAIARAATLCTGRVLTARAGCAAAQLRGESCDEAALEHRVSTAIARAFALVQDRCSAEDLQNLRYIDLSDAQRDVSTVCRDLDTSATTASYGPVMFGGTIAAVDDGARQACLDATGRAAARLLRFAMRARSYALDEVASTPMTPAEKSVRVARSARPISRAVQMTERRVLAACPAETFEALYGEPVEDLLRRIAGQADCLGQGVYVQNAVTCPPPVCGDGMQASPEQCDDRNDYEGDGCRADCSKAECDVFPTTYDLIQRAIFENHGCTESACHGSSMSGGLDLRAGASYEALFKQPSGSVPGMTRVVPGDRNTSLLWINLAAATYPGQVEAPLRAMPVGLPAISDKELNALRLWIEVGAAERNANVPEAAALLDACVPEPVPVKIDPLPPPAAGTGIQFRMPGYALPAKSETEVCFASYYDLSGQVPAAFLSEDGLAFRYKSVDIRQDPVSHHLIVDVFRGTEAPNDPAWGVYKCRGGTNAGAVCDPLDLGACGEGLCATDPDASAVACIGFGPTSGLGSLTSGGFGFAQETTAHFAFPHHVYDELPIRGVILWNSHAFNLTRHDATLDAWVNLIFPDPEEQDHDARQIFNASKIFWTDAFPPIPAPKLPAFEDQEYCHIHTFGAEGGFGDSLVRPRETAHVFELSGHMHQHGVRFQIFRGRFTCKGGANDGEACSPFEPSMCPQATCTDDGGRDPQDALLYTNLVYNDPVVLRLDPPIEMRGSAPLADRTFTYCGHYDNGKPPNIQNVKRRSTSPPGGVLFDFLTFGGPCAVSETRCIGGPFHNGFCRGDNAVCDSSPGAGDGDCDACPLTGGFRTQDEMFILFGNYWVTSD